jgi:hypothetical protein
MNTALDAGWNEISSNRLPPRAGTRPPKPVDPAVLAEKEDARLRKRERIKVAMAESQVAESRLDEINETIAKLEARKEEVAEQHVATCEPIQRELELLRQHRVDRIVAGDDDDDDELRRCELQDKIDSLNAKLENQIRDCDESLKPLYSEQLAVARSIDSTLRGDLLNLASAENRLRLLVARSRVDWCGRRVKSIRDAIIDRPFDTLLPHLLADAEKMLADADAMSRAAVQNCVDE